MRWGVGRRMPFFGWMVDVKGRKGIWGVHGWFLDVIYFCDTEGYE